MPLDTYIEKRRFEETPEPRGKVEKSRGSLKFVIQKHQATRLHYDFRLEMEGVMKSWAVPKGPSLNPSDKRLAMMTEDHPLSYRTFEGTIPEDNYGAGDVIVWDEGTYEAKEGGEQELLRGLVKGHINFVMHGKRVKGLFSLVKMHGGEKNAWLLVKKEDPFASKKDITEDKTSVRSKKSLGDEPHAKIEGVRKKSLARKIFGKDKMPHSIRPMLATLTDEPFDNPNWIFEIKWDGYRAVSEIEKGKIKLYSRTGQPFEDRYHEIVAALQSIEHDVIMDGEIVAMDKNGKSQFQYLQSYGIEKQGVLQYRVFDLLYIDGMDLRSLPLVQRKELLQKIIPQNSAILYSDHIEGQGTEFFERAIKQGLEGVMAKDAQSIYETGTRTKAWLKIKTHNRQEVVICGYTEPRGSRKYFGSLILGVYEKGELRYVGHTGTGFNQKSLKHIYDQLRRREQKESPFGNPPKTNAPVTWVRPDLLCEVEFTEWTKDGQMRHPSFQGLRNDKPATTAIKEKPMKRKANNDVKVTNLDKIYWPKDKYTKGDLIEYYKNISDVILPYLKGRPQSLHRHPNGIKGESFFQKNVTTKVPDFVETTKLRLESEKRTITSIVCNNEETLLYLANLGCIELNPWNAKVGQLDYPDWGVVDLDPGNIGFDKVIEAAQVTHKILDKISVPSFPKTSGKTGIHIFIPMGGKYTHEQVRQFIEIVVTMVHHQLPKTTSLERSPSKRKIKIYLDYLQNRIGQTLAAPYSLRPWPGATVSAPLQWKEVDKKLDPSNYTMRNIFKRIEKYGDLWKPVIGKGIDLPKAIKKLEKLL